MSLTLEQITEEAMQLPATSRALLADKLVESLESEDLDEIQRLWSAEAIRRRDEVRSGQVRPVSGRESWKRYAVSWPGAKTSSSPVRVRDAESYRTESGSDR